MKRVDIFISEAKHFGFFIALARILIKIKIWSEYDLYALKVKKYYSQLPPNLYRDELKKWLSMIGKSINIDSPTTFSEKIQWLKLYDLTEEKKILSNKFLVRNWVQEQIGEEYLVPLLGVWKSVDEIDFELLPNKFCLKVSNGSNMTVLVQDKASANIHQIKNKIKKWMKCDFGWEGLELQYVGTQNYIIAEELLEPKDGDLKDYKFSCFNGEPKNIAVIEKRNMINHTAYESCYDMEWVRNDAIMSRTYTSPIIDSERPENFEQMVLICKKLCKGFKYVRVDLYSFDGSIRFGEMTFTPSNGLDPWDDPKMDEFVGSWIDCKGM